MFLDAEEFANKHSSKFNVVFNNKSTASSSTTSLNNIQRSASVDKIKAQKKNVSFIENPNISTNLSSSNDEDEYNNGEKNNNKSILKNSSKSRSPSCSLSSFSSEDPITSRSSIGLKVSPSNDSAYCSSSSSDYLRASNPDLSSIVANKSDSDISITANTSKKTKLEGYEILVIYHFEFNFFTLFTFSDHF